jgi:hypothetical protein
VIASQLRELFINSSYFFYTFKSRCTNWFKVRLLREHNRIEILGSPYQGQARIAIIALWARPAILNSVLRLIDFLIVENVHVVCVLNKSKMSEEWIAEINKRDASILLRPNVGRDFGAYRAGFHFVKERIGLEKITNLIFANDSVFFLDGSKEALKNVIDSNKDVTSLFLNFQFHLHAQSFFVNYKSNVIKSKTFIDFWKSYYPSQERKHAINNGEVKLSKLLQKRGYQFQGYYSAEYLLKTLSTYKPNLPELANIYKLHGDAQSLRKKEYLPDPFHSLFTSRTANSENVSHLFATYLTRTVGAPLKLDVLKTGAATTNEVSAALQSKVDESELEDLVIYMQSQGTWASNRGIKSLWISRGLIS